MARAPRRRPALRLSNAAARQGVLRSRHPLPDPGDRRQRRRVHLDRRELAPPLPGRGPPGAPGGAGGDDPRGERIPGHVLAGLPRLPAELHARRAFIAERITGITLTIGDRAERATGSVVSSNYFDALGVR